MLPWPPTLCLSTGRRLAGYALAAVLSLGLLAWLYDLAHRDLRIPLEYSGDALDTYLYCKMMLEHGWPLRHPGLGAPHGLTLHDYQRSANLQLALIKALSCFADDPFLLAHLYFLLTFPLTTLVSLAVLRHLGLRYLPALSASLLFSFLSYHHHRGLTHLFLAGYYLVPVSVLLAVWVWREQPLFRRPHLGQGLLAVFLAVLVGSAEIYYAFFTCFFLLLAGLAVARRHVRWRAAVPAATLITVVALAAVANLGPQLLYRARHGGNPDAGRRSAWDAQQLDLRIIQMLMPATGHRVPLLRQAKERFNRHLPLVNENDMASLGMLASIGFLYLLVRLLQGAAIDPRQQLLRAVSLFAVCAVLLGTMGGLGSMFAFAFPHIRCYNRLSVFIAFFSLLALAHLLERLCGSGRLRPLALTGCGLLTVAGVWEQTPAQTAVGGEALRRRFLADRAFVRAVEQARPASCMIFQLPHVFYPEGSQYDGLRLSLHAAGSRWSFPAMRGRYPDLWQREACRLPVAEMADRLCWAGFTGICCDRDSGKPAASECERRLRQLLGAPALVSEDGRWAYYSLAEHARKLRAGVGPTEAEQLRQEALYPVVVRWDRGFQQLAEPVEPVGRWGDRRAGLLLLNPAVRPRTVVVEMHVQASPAGPGTLQVRGPGLAQEQHLDEKPRLIRLEVELPPGRTALEFRCNCPCHPDHARRHFFVAGLHCRPAGLPGRATSPRALSRE